MQRFNLVCLWSIKFYLFFNKISWSFFSLAIFPYFFWIFDNFSEKKKMQRVYTSMPGGLTLGRTYLGRMRTGVKLGPSPGAWAWPAWLNRSSADERLPLVLWDCPRRIMGRGAQLCAPVSLRVNVVQVSAMQSSYWRWETAACSWGWIANNLDLGQPHREMPNRLQPTPWLCFVHSLCTKSH